MGKRVIVWGIKVEFVRQTDREKNGFPGNGIDFP